MRIATSTVYNQIATEMQSLDTSQNQLQAEVSSGLAVTQPSDNPAAMGQALNEIEQGRQTTQYIANANTALSVAQASGTGLTQLGDLSNQLASITTEASSGTVSASELQSYGAQVNQLLEQAVQLGNTQFAGAYLYGGTAVSSAPFTATRDASGDITSVAYAGNSGSASIPISTTSAIAPTTSGATNQAIASFMNQIVALRDALNAGDTATVSTTDTALSSSGDTLITATADNAAMQSRIEAEQSVQNSLSANLSTTISSLTSADLPNTMIKLTQAETAYQAVLQSSAKIMQTSLLQYINLG